MNKLPLAGGAARDLKAGPPPRVLQRGGVEERAESTAFRR